MIKFLNFSKYLHGLDSYERHKAVADALIGSERNSCTILDVGGETRFTTNRLAYFLQDKEVITANVIAQTSLQVDDVLLPLDDKSFDAVVSIDTIEHIPKEKREKAFREYLRIAKNEVVIVGPIDSEEQRSSEIRLNDKYKKLFGIDHHYIIEHIRYGDPSEEELKNLIGDKNHKIIYFADIGITEKHIERSFSFCPKIKPFNKIFKLFYIAFTIKDYKSIKYLDSPLPNTRRFLAHIKL